MAGDGGAVRAARAALMEARREELRAIGELPPHEAEVPAGQGEPVLQPPAGEMRIEGKGKRAGK